MIRFIIATFQFCCLFSSSLMAQRFNIRIDSDNMNHSYAIINNTLLQVFGEDSIAKWLSDNKRMLFRWEIDSVGNVLSMEQLSKNHPQSKILSENNINRILLWMRQNDIHLPWCIDNDPPCSYEEHELSAMEIYSNDNHFYNIIGFPGWAYTSERSLEDKSERSDIECMKTSIQHYIVPTIREMVVTKNIKLLPEGQSDVSDCAGVIHSDNYFYDAYDILSFLYEGKTYSPKLIMYYLKKVELSDEINYIVFCDTVNVPNKYELYNKKGKELASPELKIQRNEITSELMYYMAQSYIQKYHSYDFFTLACAKRILQINPDSELGLKLMKEIMTNQNKSHCDFEDKRLLR